MHIAFVTTGDIHTIATSKRAFGLAEPLAKLGYRVSIVAEYTANNRLRMEQEAPGAQGLWFERSSPLAEAKRKREILREHAPDYVYVCALGARNLAWSPGLRSRARFVIEHSELSSAIKNQSLLRRAVALGLEKTSLAMFDGHVVASKYLERHISRDLARYALERSIHYSPYAFSESMLKSNIHLSERLRGIAGSRKVLLYMGTLSRNYGILDIIESVGALRDDIPDVLLFVLGHGRDAAVAEATVQRLGLQDHVRLEGYVSDEALPCYLELADAFVAPLYDTIQDIARCPSKLFLYIPYQRPIVTCRIGEAEALFGDYGHYFRPGNVDDMTRALRGALRLGRDWAAPWSVEAHSWDRRARDMDVWLRTLPLRGGGRERMTGQAR